MCAADKRIDLFIDVFDHANQHASARRELMPAELIGAILQEFGELDYLTDEPDQYELVITGTDAPLAPDIAIGAQLRDGSRLRLLERAFEAPRGAAEPSSYAYLSELGTGKVFRLYWLPAIIGRHDAKQAQNELVAVDLSSFPTGLRVSRRHLIIAEDGDRFVVKCLSGNPATVVRGDESHNLAMETPFALETGDILLLDRSEIRLRFVVLAAKESGSPGSTTEDATEDREDGIGVMEESVS